MPAEYQEKEVTSHLIESYQTTLEKKKEIHYFPYKLNIPSIELGLMEREEKIWVVKQL